MAIDLILLRTTLHTLTFPISRKMPSYRAKLAVWDHDSDHEHYDLEVSASADVPVRPKNEILGSTSIHFQRTQNECNMNRTLEIKICLILF
jgi:hypothetical protein